MAKTRNIIDEKRLAGILHQYGVTEASIFGSYSRGDITPGSDVDLLVTYAPGTSLFDAMSLQDTLEQELGRPVDLVSQKSTRSGR